MGWNIICSLGERTGRTKAQQLLCQDSRTEQTHSSKCRDMNMAFLERGSYIMRTTRECKVQQLRAFPASESGQVLLSQTSGAAAWVLTIRGQASAMPDNF
jgi:hypothetical protein